MSDEETLTTGATTAAAAGTTLLSSGLDDNIVVTHVDGETETITVNGTDGDDTFVLTGDGIGGDSVIGGLTAEIQAFGGVGNDTFIVNGGNVVVNGGEGDDTFVYTAGNLIVDRIGTDDSTVNLIVDNDALTLSDFIFFPVDVGIGLPGFNDLLTLVDPFSDDSNEIIFTDQFLLFDPATEETQTIFLQVNDGPVILLDDLSTSNLSFGADDVVTGSLVFTDGGDDVLTGTDGDDVLVAGTEDDTLEGLLGSDFLDGGQGDDIFTFTFEGGETEDFYIAGAGTDTLRINVTQDEFDTLEIRNELVSLIDFVAQNADPTFPNGEQFVGSNLGLTAVDFENIEVFVDGVLTEGIEPIVIDIAPVVSGNPLAAIDLTDVDIPFEFNPVPQDFPELVERQRVDPESLINGTNRSNLTFENDHQVDVNFVTEGAGFRNTLGFYTVEDDGTITNVSFLAENASGTGRGVFGGGDFNPGDLIADLGTVEAGTEIGFFIVANGFRINNSFRDFDLENGTLEFRNTDTDSLTNIDDSYANTDLVFVDAGGEVQDIRGNIFHASSANLNSDGIVHSISGLNEEGVLTISFEDLPNLGDADFEDLVFELNIFDATGVELEPLEIASDFTIVDEDDNTISELLIEITGGEQFGDSLSINSDLLIEADLTLEQIDDSTLRLSGDDTAQAYQDVLQSLVFSSASEDPSAGDREVTVTVTDADGLTDSAVITVSIGPSESGLGVEDVLSDTDPLGFLAEGASGEGGEGAAISPDFDAGLNIDDLVNSQPTDTI